MMTAFSLLDDSSGGGGCSTSVVEFDEELTVTIENWNGEPGRRLSWAFSDGDDLTDFSNSLWISDRTGAIHHWKIQRSFESWGESGGTEDEPFSWSSTLEISCSEVQLNPALGPVDFRFTPPDGAIEVETSPSRWLDEQLPWEERTAATITLAEGSVEDLSPELLVSIHQTRIGRRLSQRVLSTGVAAVHVHRGVGGAPSQIWCVTENGLEIIELAR